MGDNGDGIDILARLDGGRSLLLEPRARTWAELQAIPQPEYLIKGVCERGTLIEVYGPTSCGKSFFALDMDLCLAFGREWYGHRVHQCGVVYFSAEGGHAIKRRGDAWQDHHDVDLATLSFHVVIEPTDLLSDNGVEQVLRDCEVVSDLGMVTIDTAARVMPGGSESAEDMSKFVQACDRIRCETGATVKLVHHSGKDASRGSRGSTVLPAACDTVIEIKRDNTTKVATAILEKQRDGNTGDLLHFKLDVIELGTDEDGDPITSCVVNQSNAPIDAPKPLSANQETMFRILREAMPSGLTLDEWNDKAREVGLAKNRAASLYDFRNALKEKKLVHEYGGRWYAAR